MNEKTEMMASMIKNLALLLLEQNNELTMEQALSKTKGRFFLFLFFQ